jgi:hypothetical protein
MVPTPPSWIANDLLALTLASRDDPVSPSRGEMTPGGHSDEQRTRAMG